MNLDTLFTEIRGRAEKTSPIGATLRFDLGENQIFLDGTGAENQVTQDHRDADCVIQIKAEDLNRLLDGSLNPVAAFMSGKVKVKGDMGVAMRMQSFLG